MTMEKQQIFTLGLLLSVAVSYQSNTSEWIQKEASSHLGIQVNKDHVQAIIQKPTLFKETESIKTQHPTVSIMDFLDESVKNPGLSIDVRSNNAAESRILTRLVVLNNPANIAEATHLITLRIGNTATRQEFDAAVRLRALGGGLAGGANEAQITAALYLQAGIIIDADENQINGGAAFIAGGHAGPTQPEVNGWVADAPTRAERVLVGAAGLDATDAALIAGATRCVAVGIGAPTADQINGAPRCVAVGIGAPTARQINGATRCVAVGIGAPTADQINGAAAFIAAGIVNASANEINIWVGEGNKNKRKNLVKKVAGNGILQQRFN